MIPRGIASLTAWPTIIGFPNITQQRILGNQESRECSRGHTQYLDTEGDYIFSNSLRKLHSVEIKEVSGDTPSYIDLGNCDQVCRHYRCLFWYNERLKGAHYTREAEYHLCCGGGRIYMPPTPDRPAFIQQLLTNSHFMEHIQAYSQMFTMTYFGAKIDNSRKHFGELNEGGLNPDIFEGFIHVLDEHNGLLRLFITARNRYNVDERPGFKIRLYSVGGVRGYELPTSDIIIVFKDGPRSRTDFDVIIKFRGGPHQRINKLHQSYMSLQFLLLFVFGEPGFYPELTLKPQNGKGNGKKVTMNAYYKYQLHTRVKEFGLILRGERLCQQYVVAVFCAIELSRLDFIQKKQNDLQSNYLSGLYDAISRGDREGILVGSKIMLPNTFTRGPRADIVCRVFEQKVKDFIKFLKTVRTFGYVSAVLYTIEFQKRGLPHYHTLLWVDSKGELQDTELIDEFNSAEIPNPVEDPRGPDRILAKISDSEASASLPGNSKQIDEIQNYVDGRFICPYEARWRIFDFLIHYREPAVQILSVHLENMQRVNFRKRDRLDVIVNLPDKKKRLLLNGELFYFRMLLCHQKGCRSPVEVRTVNDQIQPTYQVACDALGLLGDDKEWGTSLEESTALGSSKEIRILFSQILMNYDVADLNKLWIKHWEATSASISNRHELLFVYGHDVASSGIASVLLPGGRTTLSRFKLPLELTDERCFETLDRTLRNLMDASSLLFGGKTVVLGGDFRQTLPVKKGAGKDELIAASIAESHLWWHFKICTLKENMRLLSSDLTTEKRQSLKGFANWLLDVGNDEIGDPDEEDGHNSSWITIPSDYLVARDKRRLSELIDFIYDDTTLRAPDNIK
nr:DNA helicase [Tanacetum cinerariifolium]